MESKQQKHSYNIYPSLLDSYNSYRDCEEVWLKYWGNSENPSKTLEEFREEKRLDLIDKINREPWEWKESEKADRGTAYNEVVDRIIQNKFEPSDTFTFGRVGDTICAAYNKRMFYFDANFCKKVAQKYPLAIPQVFCEGYINTRYGVVRLYGYIDGLCLDYIVDYKLTHLKRSEAYVNGKFRGNMQHLVYPYCCEQNGQKILHFIYDVARVNKEDLVMCENIEEVYPYIPDEAEVKIRSVCEEFIGFLEEHRAVIRDKKIFNLPVDEVHDK